MAGEESSKEKGLPRRRGTSATIDVPASEVSTPTTPDLADAGGSTVSAQPANSAFVLQPGPADPAATPDAAAPPPPTETAIPASGALPVRPSRQWRGQLIAAAMAGAVVVLIAAGALWRFGINQSHDGDTAELAARLAKIESVVARSAQQVADSKLSDDVVARIAKIEAALSSPNSAGDPTLSDRIGALEAAVKSVTDSVSKLNSLTDDSAAAWRLARAHIDSAEQAISNLRLSVERQRDLTSDKSEMERVSARIAALETATRSVQQKIDPQGGTTADRSVRRALLASALRDKVIRGVPFAAELSAIKALGGDAASLSALEPFAAGGLPTADSLSAELVALLPKLNATSDAPPRTGTLMERLQANASHLVRIRPIGEAAGDDTATIVSRIELKAARADIDGAIAELQRLPPATLAPAAGWIAKAKSRQAAITAAQDFATNMLGALAQAAQQP